MFDNRLNIPINGTLVATAAETPTLVFTNSDDTLRKANLRSHKVDVIESEAGGRDLIGALAELKERDIQSVLVEGGAEIAGAFCDAGLVDKITFFVAPIIIGGKKAPNAIGGNGADSLTDALNLRDIIVTPLGDDIEITGYPTAA